MENRSVRTELLKNALSHAVGGAGDLSQEGVGERGLAGRGAAGDEDVLAVSHGGAEHRGLAGQHDAGGDIVVEGEDGDGGLADRKSRRGHHRRQQALEPLSRFGQLGRDTRFVGMDFRADMGECPVEC